MLTLTTAQTTELQELIARRARLAQELTDLAVAMRMVDERMSQLLQPQAEAPTVVEPEADWTNLSVPEEVQVLAPEPELKVKSIAQEKAEANAKVALANKGKSTKEKAEALDTTPATVNKVEKAKATQKLAKAVEEGKAPDLKAADLRKLAKELKVDVTKVDFRSKTQRQALQAELQSKQAQAKQWTGLSASRQARLQKLAATTAN